MAKQLKLNIKNAQLAEAVGLDKRKAPASKPTPVSEEKAVPPLEEPKRVRAKSHSAFVHKEEAPVESSEVQAEPAEAVPLVEEVAAPPVDEEEPSSEPPPPVVEESPEIPPAPAVPPQAPQTATSPPAPPRVKLGPTGRHVNDLLPKRRDPLVRPTLAGQRPQQGRPFRPGGPAPHARPPAAAPKPAPKPPRTFANDAKPAGGDVGRKPKVKEFRDLKPARKTSGRPFDGRDRQGLGEEDDRWRKRRPTKSGARAEESAVQVTELTIRLPISVKDLASEMKLKASVLLSKLLMHSIPLTLNDMLDDETVVQLLGEECGCTISIDSVEEERIRITNKSIREEIAKSAPEELQLRPPVVTFMGHVDHGKTSLIDTIRKSNRAASEAGAITQHMGAFCCQTDVGPLTVLDTPGHEAFSAMRARGAEVTDIVVLVVAGDEGLRQQTLEAIEHARKAQVPIVVALNKCDKPNFHAEEVYRQLADQNLLPEAWGGQTITVSCSAVTGEGIKQLLEMLALQAEVLELRANPLTRARGSVLESEMHKGFGPVATILVQNGTLRVGDAVVFEHLWGRIKTMKNEFGIDVQEATPSMPVVVTGLSGLPAAGDPFIVVKSEKEAREIAEARVEGARQLALQQKRRFSLESMLQDNKKAEKKILRLILKGDVQGSVEALKTSLLQIHSEKAAIEILAQGVGEISESDVELAIASQASIVGFHTKVESHAEGAIKQFGVTVRLHDLIYHAIDDVKGLLRDLLDKLPEEKELGVAEVKALFKASQLGVIAGCQVLEGTILRNQRMRAVRQGTVVWDGPIASLKRLKEDVREVKKGLECGILLSGFTPEVGDLLRSYEITYIAQEL